jgi:hypothetical protein
VDQTNLESRTDCASPAISAVILSRRLRVFYFAISAELVRKAFHSGWTKESGSIASQGAAIPSAQMGS